MRECEEKKDGSFKIDRSVYSESDLRNEMAECGNSEWFICDRSGCFNKVAAYCFSSMISLRLLYYYVF